MRLTPQEITAFIGALTPYAKGTQTELRLYGSRVDDSLKGGDIDLLIIAPDETMRMHLVENKHKILGAIYSVIGE